MRPEQIILPLKESLERFAKGWGHVSVAKDPFNVYEQLTQGPDGTLIVLHWDGDASAGQSRMSPIVDNRIEVYVGRNRGLTLNPNESLLKKDLVYGGNPLYESASDVREHLRAFDFNTVASVDETQHERSLSYAGAESVALPEGLPMAATKLTFTLITSLPAIVLPGTAENESP